MTNARPTISFPRQTVVRRNVPQRLAGAGYAVVTAGWLVATLSQMKGVATGGTLVGETLFGLLTLVGLTFAFYRDDVSIDHSRGIIRTSRGLPGLLRTTEAPLHAFDRLVVEEEGIEDYPEDAIQPVRRAWFSVYLSDSRSNQKLLLLSKPSEETPKARNAALNRATDQARHLSLVLDLPIAE